VPGVAWHALPAAVVLAHPATLAVAARHPGGRARPCPACKAQRGDPRRTPSGREARRPHIARLRAGPFELIYRDDVWAELERRRATVAMVLFSGCAGLGGKVGTIALPAGAISHRPARRRHRPAGSHSPRPRARRGPHPPRQGLRAFKPPPFSPLPTTKYGCG